MSDATRAEAPLVVIAVTFREFNGSENDRVQRLFLESIQSQSYANWLMVVTVFNEKTVEQEISRLGIRAVIHQGGPVSEYKFSLTDVLLNAAAEAERHQEAIIIWTTCDVVLQQDFFEQVVTRATPRFFAVSHPHLTFESTVALAEGRAIPSSANSGIDLVAMSARLFADPRFVGIVRQYRFVDWGLFEHFLVGLAQLAGGARLNLFGLSGIQKIENDRVVGAETQAWLQRCWERNQMVMDAFIAEHRLSTQLYDLLYCHRQFTVVWRGLRHYAAFAGDYFEYGCRLVRRNTVTRLPVVVKRGVRRMFQ